MQTHRDIWFSNGGDESEWLYFNTRKYPFPVLELVPYPLAVPGLIFPDGSQMVTAGGGGGGGVSWLPGPGISMTPGVGTMTIAAVPAGTNGQIQINDNGVFGAVPGLVVDPATGNMGIGTPGTPNAKLAVNGEIRVSNRTVATSGYGVEIGYDPASHWGGIENFNYDTNSYQPMYVNGSVVLLNHPTAPAPTPGYVGINTNNPQYTLDVAGNINITDPGGASGYAFRINGVPIGGGGGGSAAGATGQIQFNSAGLFAASPNLFWNGTTQRLGVGTSNPQYPLDVAGDVNITGQFRINGVPLSTGGSAAGTTGEIQFNNGGLFGASASLFWNSTTQRLGVGTATPQYPVDVAGDVNITGVYRINGVPLTAGTPAGANGQIQFNNAGAFGANANLFWNNTNGWLGIGTATPAMQLHIYSGSNAQGMLQSASAYAVWHFVTDTANWVVGTGGSGTAGAGVSGTFYVQNGANGSYPIAVNSLGQVGINNTTSPSHTLDVQGDINIYSTTATPPAFRINGIAISPVYINTVPPDSPNEGNLWFDPFFLHMYVYHAGAWFQVSN